MNSRSKGAAAERELAEALRRLGFASAHRASRMYATGRDAPDVAGVPFHVECKRQERLNIHEAMNQSRIDAGPGTVPVVCHRRNGDEWLLTVPLDDLPALARAVAASMPYDAQQWPCSASSPPIDVQTPG